MAMLSDSTSCVSYANKLAERRKEEKEKFDARHQCELKPLVIGSTVSFLNSDLKSTIGSNDNCYRTWSGRIVRKL